MYWLDDEDGNLVNIEQAQTIAVQPIDQPEVYEKELPNKTHAVVVTFNTEETVWLFSGKEDACIEFRNGLRSAIKGRIIINTDMIDIEALKRG